MFLQMGVFYGRVGKPTLLLLRGEIMKKENLETIFNKLKELVSESGFDCPGCGLVKEAGLFVLRIYLDVEGAVDLKDCETVSKIVAEYLDTVESELPESYLLEVTSPGLERPLFSAEDFDTYKGKEAVIKLKKKKATECVLNGMNEDGTVSVIRDDDTDYMFAFEDLAEGHLVFEKAKGKKKTFKKIPKKKNKKKK